MEPLLIRLTKRQELVAVWVNLKPPEGDQSSDFFVSCVFFLSYGKIADNVPTEQVYTFGNSVIRSNVRVKAVMVLPTGA